MPATHVHAVAAGGVAHRAIAYGAQIAYERFRLRTNPLTAAIHVALGAALGAFGLAVGANVHALVAASPDATGDCCSSPSSLWPIITGIPAFVVALGLSAVMLWVFRGRDGDRSSSFSPDSHSRNSSLRGGGQGSAGDGSAGEVVRGC